MTVTASHEMEFTALRVLELAPGETYAHACGDHEWIVLPLTGGCTIRCAEPVEPSRCSNSAGARVCSAG